MTAAHPEPVQAALDLEGLELEAGGHLLVKHALRHMAPGDRLEVAGDDPNLAVHLAPWCRTQGHRFRPAREGTPSGPRVAGWVERGSAQEARWSGAEPTGGADAKQPGSVVDRPAERWGLAARGATVERGAPEFHFALHEKDMVWADEAKRIYDQAAAAQWDPESAIPWDAEFTLPDEVEDAVVQVMTYLIENETAALLVPARFLSQLHPHFREVMQLLAVQTADEARHIEVFTRRATLKRERLGLSTVGGQASLKTLTDEPDFAMASFLLSVLGEGSFLSLLWFIHEHAPDPVTREVARLAAQDEARHVAFGLAHLSRHAAHEPGLLDRMANAVHQRHEALKHTAGLNEEVFDALVLLAAGEWNAPAIRAGHERVLTLTRDMDTGRQRRLRKLGFPEAQAAELSSLHTRNFM